MTLRLTYPRSTASHSTLLGTRHEPALFYSTSKFTTVALKPHVCPDCLKSYKHFVGGKIGAKRKGLAWGKGQWPSWVYHTEPTRKCERHHAQSLADSCARRAGIKSATPKWANRSAIKDVYSEAIKKTKQTGIRHEVDHIIPLRGKNVNGLHVAENLQVIPASINRKKSNKHVSD